MQQFVNSMEEEKQDQVAINQFLKMYKSYLQDSKGCVNWDKVVPLSPGGEKNLIVDYQSLPLDHLNSLGTDALNQLVICKLNGGLGTSMGCSGPKSTLMVSKQESFLSIFIKQVEKLQQLHQIKIPIILLNSYNTDQMTKEIVKTIPEAESLDISYIIQNKFPRIWQKSDGEDGVLSKEFGKDRFYPPGHGDIYLTLQRDAGIKKLLEQGKKYIFISNSDNLGATVDPRMLGYMVEQDLSFMMEVTSKTENDKKGGTLIQYPDSNDKQVVKLLEIAQVDENHKEDFQSTEVFSVFNTNSIWVSLEQMQQKIENDQLNMDVIVNPKQVENRPVIQLEVAMGSAIASFDRSIGMLVSRNRFFPVKNTNDLFLLRSNLFEIKNGAIERKSMEKPLPVISLGSHFKNVDDFELLCPVIPDISELKSLSIKGSFQFSEGMVLKGDVVLEGGDEKVIIPKGTSLEAGTYPSSFFKS